MKTVCKYCRTEFENTPTHSGLKIYCGSPCQKKDYNRQNDKQNQFYSDIKELRRECKSKVRRAKYDD